jgi:hypothetical protein
MIMMLTIRVQNALIASSMAKILVRTLDKVRRHYKASRGSAHMTLEFPYSRA